jgi:hypothetical protein
MFAAAIRLSGEGRVFAPALICRRHLLPASVSTFVTAFVTAFAT